LPPVQPVERIPDIVYAKIVQEEPGLRNDTNTPANNDHVVYSDILSKDNDVWWFVFKSAEAISTLAY